MKGACELEIKDIDYEPEQNLLILHCGLPEMSFVLIDWHAKEVLQTNLALTLDDDFVKLKFNPLRTNQLVLVKRKSLEKLTLYRRDFLVKDSDLEKSGTLKPFLNIDMKTWSPDLEDGETFLDLCVSRREIAYVSTSKQRVLGTSLENLLQVDEFQTELVCQSLLLTRKYLIVAQSSKRLQDQEFFKSKALASLSAKDLSDSCFQTELFQNFEFQNSDDINIFENNFLPLASKLKRPSQNSQSSLQIPPLSNEGRQQSSKNIFEIEEESQQSEELGSESEGESSQKNDQNNTQLKRQEMIKKGFTSLLTFFPMGVEGERLKDQEVKKVVDIWGVHVQDMFYDQSFQHLVAVGSKGKVVTLNLPAERIEEDEEGEDEDKTGNFFGNDELSKQLSSKENLSVDPLLQWHFAKVLGLEWDTRERFLISISASGKLIFSGEKRDEDLSSDFNDNEGRTILKEIELCQQISSACIDTEEQLIFLGLEQGPLVVMCYTGEFQLFEIGSFGLVKGKNITQMKLGTAKQVLVCQFAQHYLLVVRNSWKNVFAELKKFSGAKETPNLFRTMTAHVENICSNSELEFLGAVETEQAIQDFSLNPNEQVKLDLVLLLEEGNLLSTHRPLESWLTRPDKVDWQFTLGRLKQSTVKVQLLGGGKVLGTDRDGVTTLYSTILEPLSELGKEGIKESRVQDEFEVAELGVETWTMWKGVLVVGTGEGSVRLRRVFEESQWREREKCKCLEVEVQCWGMSGGAVSAVKVVPQTKSIYVTGQHGQLAVFGVKSDFWKKGILRADLISSESDSLDLLNETEYHRTTTHVRRSPVIDRWFQQHLKTSEISMEARQHESVLATTFQILPVSLVSPGDYSQLVRKREKEEVQFKREAIEQDLLKELKNIQDKHRELLKDNEKRDGGNYVGKRNMAVDVALRVKVEKEGLQQREQLKRKHQVKIAELEHMRKVVRRNCWDGMEQHKQSVTGIQAKVVVFNFGLKKKGRESSRKVAMGKWFGRMQRLETRLWSLEEQRGGKENCNPGKSRQMQSSDVLTQVNSMVNGRDGREPAVQMDFEKRRKELMEYLEEERSKEQSKLSKQSKGLGTKKRGYEIQRRRRVKRKNIDLDSPRERKGDRQSVDLGQRVNRKQGGRNGDTSKTESVMEVWVQESEVTREEGPWFWLDSGVGLRGELQKRRGIWFGEWMVRELKQEFNTKFSEFVKQRKKKVDEIRERDLKIKEICGELKLKPVANEIFHNFLERPEELLELRAEDTWKTPYISEVEQAQRAREREEERKRIEERNKKDSVVRALKQMMNDQLEDEKENKLEKELEREEWMDKPREKMTEEERSKMDEFLEKEEALKEEKERIRKVLQQEMRKLGSEIRNIQEEFDKKIGEFFLEKLEYSLRILEQQTLVDRLRLQLGLRVKIENKKRVAEVLHQWREGGRELLQQMHDLMERKIAQKEERVKDTRKRIAEYETVNIKKEMAKVRERADVRKEEQSLQILREGGIGSYIHDMDPFAEVHKEKLLEKFKDEFVLVEGDFRKTIRGTLGEGNTKEEEFLRNLKEVYDRKAAQKELVREIEHSRDEMEKVKAMIAGSIDGREEQDLEVTQLQARLLELQEELYLVVRIRNQMVEISLGGKVPETEEAILLEVSKIEKVNDGIRVKATQKINLLKKSIEEKNKVEKSLFNVKVKELDIRSNLIECQLLSRLKVTKKLQLKLEQRGTRTQESEENNLRLQIQKLVDSTEKRVKMFRKKEMGLRKEMKFLAENNEELLDIGANLQQSVSQRKEIFSMTSGKKVEDLLEDDKHIRGRISQGKMNKASYKKTVAIGKKRRLYDEFKLLLSEIEGEMSKLRVLREKNFPHFK